MLRNKKASRSNYSDQCKYQRGEMALYEVKLCLVGDSGVGKTCVVNRFVSNVFSENEGLTVGAAFSTKTIRTGENSILFQIWDTAGQEKYRGLAPMYYRGSAAAVVVYDITSENTFDGMQTWIEELRKLGPPNLVLAVIGNKLDMEESRKVASGTGQSFAKSVNAIFYETSAKSGYNIIELFEKIAEALPLDRLNDNRQSTLKLTHNSYEADKRKCC